MKYDIDELSGVMLDRAILKALGYSYNPGSHVYFNGKEMSGKPLMDLRYSQRWDLTGPLLEKNKIETWFDYYKQKWIASQFDNDTPKIWVNYSEDTDILIAVGRSFLKSIFGTHVELES